MADRRTTTGRGRGSKGKEPESQETERQELELGEEIREPEPERTGDVVAYRGVARDWSGWVTSQIGTWERPGSLRFGIVGQAPEHRFLADTLHTTDYVHTRIESIPHYIYMLVYITT
jgi:hypothetical protein